MKIRAALPVLLALFLLGRANPASAAYSQSWTFAWPTPINQIDIYIRTPGLTFDSPGLISSTAGWQNVFTSPTLAAVAGPIGNVVEYTAVFVSQPTTPETIDIYEWTANGLLFGSKLTYNTQTGWWSTVGGADPVSGPAGQAVVPEPTTLVAAALLLLPLGFQGTRYLRKKLA